MCMLVHFNIKRMAILSAPRVLLVTYFFVLVAGNVDPEPLCLSRYDYDYKILLKTFTLEQDQKDLKQLVTKQSETIAENIKTQADLKQLVTKQSETIAEIETMQKDLKQLVDEQSETIAGMDKTKQEQDMVIASIEEALQTVKNGRDKSDTGSTFVRWGRTGCPGNGTDTVYRGYTGGSWYNHEGAAVNYLCLPTDPLLDKFRGGKSDVNYVYGAEYEIQSSFSKKLFNKDIYHHDSPCTVCHSVRSSTMMIPGRNACYDGWTMEYAGSLVSGYYGHKAASEFVCLDKDPEVVPGSQANKNGKLMYTVEAKCGSLKCPPYVDGRELTCVVCTR